MTHENTLLFIDVQQREMPKPEFFLYFKSEEEIGTTAEVEYCFDYKTRVPDTKIPQLS